MHVKWYMDTLELAELQKDLSISVRHATDTPLTTLNFMEQEEPAAQAAVHVRPSVCLSGIRHRCSLVPTRPGNKASIGEPLLTLPLLAKLSYYPQYYAQPAVQITGSDSQLFSDHRVPDITTATCKGTKTAPRCPTSIIMLRQKGSIMLQIVAA